MNSIPVYDQTSYQDLQARTQYESWLLEAVYDVAESPVIEDWPEQIVYPASGDVPVLNCTFGRGTIILGDWRPHFLEVAAPLVLVTSFKLLDMLIEWVLERNGISLKFHFSKKIDALKQRLTFPPFLASRSWLRDRLIGLYEHLEPLRGTIIHARHFKTLDGMLSVSNTKSGVGPAVTITVDELRRLAVISVSLSRYVVGSWAINQFRELHLRHTLDEIGHLHGLSSLGQKPPRFLIVQVFAKWCDSIKIDLRRIREDVARMCPDQDVVFDLRVVTVNTDESKAIGYLFPWDEINGERAQFVRAVVDIAHRQSPLPEDIDIARVSQELNMGGGEHQIVG